MVPIYYGIISEDKHSSKNVNLSLEDITEARFSKEVPVKNVVDDDAIVGGTSTSTPEKYKNVPIPMVYGRVDHAPMPYSRVGFYDGQTGYGNGHQDVFHIDSYEIKSHLSTDMVLGGNTVHQSSVYIYREGYWNVSQLSADENGVTLTGIENFSILPGLNQIVMNVGTNTSLPMVEHPDQAGTFITLGQYATGDFGEDSNYDLLVDLYFGSDDDSQGEEGGVEDDDNSPADSSDNINLWNTVSDTANGKLRIHSFQRPKSVSVATETRYPHDAMTLDIKSYADQSSHEESNHDIPLKMTRAIEWDGAFPNTDSFVEVTGRIFGRFRYSNWNRTIHVPTFRLDFGDKGLPFNSYEVITDSAYYTKFWYQCTHPMGVTLNNAHQSVYIDQGNVYPAGAMWYPREDYNNEVTAPGGNANTKRQDWHVGWDTITNGVGFDALDVTTDITDVFELTSTAVQQDSEIRLGPMEGVLRRNGVTWQDAWFGTRVETDDAGNESTVVDYHQGSGWDFTMRLYGMSAFSTILTPKLEVDYFVNVEGRTGMGYESSTGGNTPLQNPPEIVMNILRTEFNYSYNTTENVSDYNNALLSNLPFPMNFSLNYKIDGRELIENIAKNSLLVPGFNSLGEFRFNSLRDNYKYEDTIEINSKDVIKFDISRTPLRDIHTSVVVESHKDYATDKFLYKKSVGISDIISNLKAYLLKPGGDEGEYIESKYSLTFFGFSSDQDKPLEIKTDLFRENEILQDKAIPGFSSNGPLSATTNLARQTLMFYCNQHTIIKMTLPISYIYLETGDIIRLSDLLGEGKAYAYGEDYTKLQVRNGQYIYPAFYITKIKKRIDKGIEVEAMQMHYFNIENDNDPGWIEPEEELFEIFGCPDDGNQTWSPFPGQQAFNYKAFATINVNCMYAGDVNTSHRKDWIDYAAIADAITQNYSWINPSNFYTDQFKLHDQNEDGYIDIHDLSSLLFEIMDGVDDDVYGCMDCGDPNGATWGEENIPQAINCDENAIIHVQEDCLYTLYACGPDAYSVNWCKSSFDIYIPEDQYYDWCIEYEAESDDMVDSNLLMTQGVFDNYNDFTDDGEGIMSKSEIAIPSVGGALMLPPSSWHLPPWYCGWDNNNTFQDSKIHGWFCEINENHILPWVPVNNSYLDNYQSSGYNLGVYSNSGYAQQPTVFARITLKAGHRYICVPKGDGNSYFGNNSSAQGAGETWWIGSYQQQPRGIIEGGNNIQNAPVVPLTEIHRICQARKGFSDTWGTLTFDEDEDSEQLPSYFTAPSDGSFIPAHPDTPGGENLAYYGATVIPFSDINSWTNDNYAPWGQFKFSPTIDMASLADTYKDNNNWHVFQSWKDHTGVETLEYGTEYETNLCMGIHTNTDETPTSWPDLEAFINR